MALSYSWKPLRSIPNLIPSCVAILKGQYPICKAELLFELTKLERNTAPCSYGLVKHLDDTRDKGSLLAHVRLVPVTNRPGAVYAEGFCIDVKQRGQGIGEMGTMMAKILMREEGYKEAFTSIYPHFKDFYLRRSWSISKEPVHTLGANLLHTNTSVNGGPVFVSWPGNTLYPGWEWVYGGGIIATEADLSGEYSGLLVKKCVQ